MGRRRFEIHQFRRRQPVADEALSPGLGTDESLELKAELQMVYHVDPDEIQGIQGRA